MRDNRPANKKLFFFFFNEGGLGFPDIKGGKKDNGTDYRF